MALTAILQLLKSFWWVIPLLGCALFYSLWRHSAKELDIANEVIASHEKNQKSEDAIHTELQEFVIKRKIINESIIKPLQDEPNKHQLAPNVLDALKRMRDNDQQGESTTGH